MTWNRATVSASVRIYQFFEGELINYVTMVTGNLCREFKINGAVPIEVCRSFMFKYVAEYYRFACVSIAFAGFLPATFGRPRPASVLGRANYSICTAFIYGVVARAFFYSGELNDLSSRREPYTAARVNGVFVLDQCNDCDQDHVVSNGNGSKREFRSNMLTRLYK